MSPNADVIWNDITPMHRHLCVAGGPRCYPSLGLCLPSSITQRKTTLEAWMGPGAAAGLTWLCYMITQPVGCRPVKCLPALMNGCNMPCITTLHAAHSLMASHHAQDVAPMRLRNPQRARGEIGGWGGAGVESEKWRRPCLHVAIQSGKQKEARRPRLNDITNRVATRQRRSHTYV